MGLEKTAKIDKIEVIGDFKIIQCREVTEIKEDGNVISSSFHRTSFSPDQDVSAAPQEVQTAATAFWTQEIKNAYAVHLASAETKM